MCTMDNANHPIQFPDIQLHISTVNSEIFKMGLLLQNFIDSFMKIKTLSKWQNSSFTDVNKSCPNR